MSRKLLLRTALFNILVVIALSIQQPSASGKTSPGSALTVVINIPAYTLYVYKDGVPIRKYPIGVGKTVTPSALGEAKIINKVKNPTYYPPKWYPKGQKPIPPGPDNPVGTRWLGLNLDGYGIHGTNNPSSIGKAVSHGCVRLRNEDVEDLADLVSIGTNVLFVYETVIAWHDPVFQTPYLVVHPDIYNSGTNQFDNAMKRLDASGFGDRVHFGALRQALRESSGAHQAFPFGLKFLYDGMLLPEQALFQDGLTWVPDRIVQQAAQGQPIVPVTTQVEPRFLLVDDQRYSSPDLVAARLGLGFEATPLWVDLYRVRLLKNGEILDVPTFIERRGPVGPSLWVAVDPLLREFGLQVAWDATGKRLFAGDKELHDFHLIGGRAYVELVRAARALGVGAVWQPQWRYADLHVPQVSLSENPGIDAYYEWLETGAAVTISPVANAGSGGGSTTPGTSEESPDGSTAPAAPMILTELMIPLRPVAEALGIPFRWNREAGEVVLDDRLALPATLKGSRLFIPAAALVRQWVTIQASWDEAREVLHLSN